MAPYLIMLDRIFLDNLWMLRLLRIKLANPFSYVAQSHLSYHLLNCPHKTFLKSIETKTNKYNLNELDPPIQLVIPKATFGSVLN